MDVQPKKKNLKFDTDDLMDKIGQFGLFQKVIVTLLGLPSIMFAVQIFAWVFLGPILSHRCRLPYDDDIAASEFNLPEDVKKQFIPRNQKTGAWSQCSYYGDNNTVLACSKYVYDHSILQSSVLETWDLVCDKAWLGTTSISLFMAGLMVGSYIFGEISDRFGRKTSLFLGLLVQAVFNIISALTRNLVIFITCRFICGLAEPPLFSTNYLLSFELVGRSKRLNIGVINMMFFSTGYLLLSFLAYFVRDWRFLLMVFSGVDIAALSLWLVIPESPRWLLSMGKVKEARAVFDWISKYNKKPLPEDWLDIVTCKAQAPVPPEDSHSGTPDDQEERGGMLSLLRISHLRWRTMNVCFIWFVCSAVYYGLSLNTSNIGGNPYVNASISAAVEIPANILAYFILDRTGRRVPTILSYLLAGIPLLITAALPSDFTWAVLTLTSIGKFSVSLTYTVIYLFTAEMYPTFVRNKAVGLGCVFSRVGDVLAPFSYLLETVWSPLPYIILGLLSCSAGVVAFWFPETLGTQLPETITDAINLEIKKRLS